MIIYFKLDLTDHTKNSRKCVRILTVMFSFAKNNSNTSMQVHSIGDLLHNVPEVTIATQL